MELPESFAAEDGTIVVNFGLLTGREATMAEIDRLARSVSSAGGQEICIVSKRTQTYSGSIETVLHQVVAASDGVAADELHELCDLWVRDCAADRKVAPL